MAELSSTATPTPSIVVSSPAAAAEQPRRHIHMQAHSRTTTGTCPPPGPVRWWCDGCDHAVHRPAGKIARTFVSACEPVPRRLAEVGETSVILMTHPLFILIEVPKL